MKTAGENEEPATPDRMPSRPREATLAWLQQYADDHPFTLVITHAVVSPRSEDLTAAAATCHKRPVSHCAHWLIGLEASDNAPRVAP